MKIKEIVINFVCDCLGVIETKARKARKYLINIDCFEYTIKSGDSIQEIALSYYNDLEMIGIIRKINRIKLGSPIYVGQILKLPKKKECKHGDR